MSVKQAAAGRFQQKRPPDNCRYSPAESLLANIDRKKTGLTRKGGSFMTYLQEDDILGIVRITEKEKETYYQMSKYRSFIKDIYDEVFKAIWEKFITGIIIMFAVYEKKTNSICALLHQILPVLSR